MANHWENTEQENLHYCPAPQMGSERAKQLGKVEGMGPQGALRRFPWNPGSPWPPGEGALPPTTMAGLCLQLQTFKCK
jgi:hypothetical protein